MIYRTPSGKMLNLREPTLDTVDFADVLENLAVLPVYPDRDYSMLAKMYNTSKYLSNYGFDQAAVYHWYCMCTLYSFNIYSKTHPITVGITETPTPFGIPLKHFLVFKFGWPVSSRGYYNQLDSMTSWEMNTLYPEYATPDTAREYEPKNVATLSTNNPGNTIKAEIYDNFHVLKRRFTR